MLKTILAPLDGSYLAEQALGPASSLAHDTGASVVLIYAHVPDRERVDAQEYLHSIQQRLEGDGLSVRTEVLPSRAATAILAAAQEQQADLICMSSHGMTGLRHASLGSVTESVVQQAHTPILVVHGSQDAARHRCRCARFSFPSMARRSPNPRWLTWPRSRSGQASSPLAACGGGADCCPAGYAVGHAPRRVHGEGGSGHAAGTRRGRNLPRSPWPAVSWYVRLARAGRAWPPRG